MHRPVSPKPAAAMLPTSRALVARRSVGAGPVADDAGRRVRLLPEEEERALREVLEERLVGRTAVGLARGSGAVGAAPTAPASAMARHVASSARTVRRHVMANGLPDLEDPGEAALGAVATRGPGMRPARRPISSRSRKPSSLGPEDERDAPALARRRASRAEALQLLHRPRDARDHVLEIELHDFVAGRFPVLATSTDTVSEPASPDRASRLS